MLTAEIELCSVVPIEDGLKWMPVLKKDSDEAGWYDKDQVSEQDCVVRAWKVKRRKEPID